MPLLALSEGEAQQLRSIASFRSLPHSIVQRAQILLACGAGESNTSIGNDAAEPALVTADAFFTMCPSWTVAADPISTCNRNYGLLFGPGKLSALAKQALPRFWYHAAFSPQGHAQHSTTLLS